ncbi:MAG TPA: serine hydrolase domain-containing protein [Terriglobales bacterium]|nr:serine hydrolase domain-containing protein [Terriglobales bacterium]
MAGAALGQSASLPAALRAQVDTLAQQTLAQLGSPSASIAIVRQGRLAYAQAYGQGRILPPAPATPAMRYSVGSISKQFTAAAVMLLVEQGKLKLDDRVGQYLPGLTRANQVTIRELLSHTSGYEDYAPQDYMIPAWLRPTTPQAVVNHWARLPLNFNPGTQWQYSNTNYKIAGLIAEKASGEPLFQFLAEHIFTPLGMAGVLDLNRGWLGPSDAQGTIRHALGPNRPAPATAPGWDFGDGELAMTAANLARWQISLLRQNLLRPSSYRAMETPVALRNGTVTRYGLGLEVGALAGHRYLGHSGEEIGFTAQEYVFPGAQTAVVVLTNQSANATAAVLARRLATLLLAPKTAPADAALAQARRILLGLQQGKLDRSLFTADANFYFDAQALADYASSLRPLGPPLSFTALGQQNRGGMRFRSYLASFASRRVEVSTYTRPDGKIEQYLVVPHE